MNLVNLLRDQTHVTLGQAQYVVGIESPMSTQTAYLNGSGIVYQTVGTSSQPYNSVNATTSFARWRCAGLLMGTPATDPTPYRVKAYVSCRVMKTYLITGYAPSSPTGTNDLISKVVAFPLTNTYSESCQFDEVLLLPGLKEGDTDFGKAVAFGIAASGTSAGQLAFNISVQNLSKTAPQYAASMS